MSDYTRDEIEDAFRHLWQVGPVGEDWTAQVDLYTDDCVYFDHHYGTMDPEEFGSWCNTLMNEQFPELYTAYEWHKIDGDEVVVLMQNRRDNPDPSGPPYLDFPVSAFTATAGTAGSPASATIGTWGRPSRWAGPTKRRASVTTRTIPPAVPGCTGRRALTGPIHRRRTP